MTDGIDTRADRAPPAARAPSIVTTEARALRDLAYADVRLEVAEGKFAAAENGAAKSSGDDYAFALRACACSPAPARSRPATSAAGSAPPTSRTSAPSCARACGRPTVARVGQRGGEGRGAGQVRRARRVRSPTRAWRPSTCGRTWSRPSSRSTPGACRSTRWCAFATRRLPARRRTSTARVSYNYIVVTTTQLARELFASSEGALIDQSFALTQGLATWWPPATTSSQEIYDVVGHQRGWEILTGGRDRAAHERPALRRVRAALARGGGGAGRARPRCPASTGPVTVVTDPHYNTLVSHEIVGHPVELDRGLKMETAYAGRSWLLRGLGDHEVGRAGRLAAGQRVLRSGPARLRPLRATTTRARPARRVDPHRPRRLHRLHEQPPDRGRLRRRAQRALEGHRRARWCRSSACPPRCSRPATATPPTIIGEVDHGYYLVGHKIPSIAESRENFRISARRVYEIQRRPARPALPRRRHHGGHARLPDARGRGRPRLPPLPDSQLRQGPAHADASGSATAAPPCAAARSSPEGPERAAPRRRPGRRARARLGGRRPGRRPRRAGALHDGRRGQGPPRHEAAGRLHRRAAARAVRRSCTSRARSTSRSRRCRAGSARSRARTFVVLY